MTAKKKAAESEVRAWLRERYPDDGLMLLEGPEFDEAIIGVAERIGLPATVAYDYRKLAPIVMRKFGCEWDEALDHVGYNVTGFADGPTSPIFIDTFRPGHDPDCNDPDCTGDPTP